MRRSVQRSVMDAFVAERTGLGAAFSPETLRNWQVLRLKELMSWLVAVNPFFRERLAFAAPGVLESIPFTTAEELREFGSSFCQLPQREIGRIVTLATSGTSGPPKRLYFSDDDLEATRDFYAHGMAEVMAPGDTALILMGSASAGGMGELLSQGISRLGGRALFHGPVATSTMAEGEAVKLLSSLQPDCIVGLPAQIFRLSRLVPALRPKNVLLSGDYLPMAVRRAVEEAWRCEVFDHYGLTESGYGGAVECGAHEGYHLRDADLLVEIIDPDSGESLPDGESGEVVITTLRRTAMPLLRYRTGDRARMLPGPCACGSPLRRLGRIEGRISAQKPSITELDEVFFAFPTLLGYEARLEGGRLRIFAELLDDSGFGLEDLAYFVTGRINASFTLELKKNEPQKSCGSLKRKLG